MGADNKNPTSHGGQLENPEDIASIKNNFYFSKIGYADRRWIELAKSFAQQRA